MDVHVRLVCSDGGCASLWEAFGPGLELDSLGCECGCALQVIGWPIGVDGRGDGAVALVSLDR